MLNNSIQNPFYLTFNLYPMKNAAFGLLAILLVALSFTSCKKEDSFAEKLVGQWHSSKVTYDNNDATGLFNFKLHLENSREFDLTLTTITGTQASTGNWEPNATTEEVTLINDSDGITAKYDITQVNESRMTAETVYQGKRLVIIFDK